MNKNKMAISIN